MGSGFGGMPRDSLYREGRGVQGDYEAFIDHMLLHTNEEHWESQIVVASSNGVFVPTVCHRLDDIREKWENYFKGYLPWANSWSKLPVSDYRKPELLEFYARDIKLYRAIPPGGKLSGAQLAAALR
jgi:hypothetical protein